MTPLTDPSYTAQALRTESPITPALQTRLQQQARLVHAVLGLQTEAGELADPVKKHIYYGRPLDPVNLREEIGDCLWYLSIACDALGTTLEAEQARNLAKLRARYPHVFTAESAQVRDLDRERQVLEGNDLGTLVQQSQRAVSDAFSEVNFLRHQLDAANAAETLQRTRIERLHKFVGKARLAMWPEDLKSALAELDAGTEPTPVAEPAPCPECERLRAVIDQAWQRIQQSISHADVAGLLAALAEIQSNSSATITSSPTPVAEPLDAEGVK